MASYRELDAVGRNRARFVSMAKQCLALPVNEWERDFLESLIRGSAMMGPPQRLSLHQTEVLFEIRDHANVMPADCAAVRSRLARDA